MPKHNFDISSVSKDGYLIFPLSMSRLANALSGREIYNFLEFFAQKIRMISIDVIFLYTNDLYLNSDDTALGVRKKTLNQMVGHKEEFLNILYKDRKYIPQAFHFLPWDFAILNGTGFNEKKQRLLGMVAEDTRFRKTVQTDLSSQGRNESEANINFLLEEIVVTHMLTNKSIPLPHTLTQPDGWRLICYPGNPITSLSYTYSHKLLPSETGLSEPQSLFTHSFYNMQEKLLLDLESSDVTRN